MAKEQTERLGRRIRERRDELDLTQKEVAARMVDSPSVDSQQISKWERGEHRPADDNLDLLADALETTVADLVSGPLAERKKKGETPDLMAQVNGNGSQLDRIEAKLDQILAQLTDQYGHTLKEAVTTLQDDVQTLDPKVASLERDRRNAPAAQDQPDTPRKAGQGRTPRRRAS